ncbi:RcnB family protein [Tatumella sp. JGM118]|uniref:RcnB family protein n=1 Tax=Tatumella terrea TaxID=419007 RepID=A0ABW1W1H9_9GAMM|nr:RcnB family protein [Tatumella sp. JGM118]MBS0910466.1 RcnB family protein [Tatumella sp. JGM118]
MKKTRMTYLISAVLLGSLVSSVAVRADDHGPWQPHGGGHQEGPGRGGPGGPGGPGPHGGPGGPHGGPHGGYQSYGPGPGGPGPGRGNSFAWQGHHFEPGQRFPHDFRGPRYRVDDWHRRGLPAPPYGQRWSYIDGNYVLVAVATGVITSIILNNAFHP